MRALREAGWLEYQPGAGDIVTSAGSSAYEILQLLRRKLESGDILPTVASLEHAISVGADKLGLLDSLYLKLTQDSAEIDDALASHSEVVLKATAKKIEEALSHSSHINALLDRIPKDTPRTWQRIREIHDQLSRLHGRIAELHSAITEVGRQYLRLTAGLTTQQIVEALMRKPKELPRSDWARGAPAGVNPASTVEHGGRRLSRGCAFLARTHSGRSGALGRTTRDRARFP